MKRAGRKLVELDPKVAEEFDSKMMETFVEKIVKLTGLYPSTLYRHIEFAEDLANHLGEDAVEKLKTSVMSNDTIVLGKLARISKEHALDVIGVYRHGGGRKAARKLAEKYELEEALAKLRDVPQEGSTVGGTEEEPFRNVTLYGDALVQARKLPPDHVHVIITSPPFYGGVRDYGTRSWIGGRENCAHTRKEDAPQTCLVCGAWQGQLGHEPTVAMYIEHLAAIFRELRGRLHPRGTVWIEVDDSRYGSGKGPTGVTGIGNQQKRQGHRGRRTSCGEFPPKSLCLVPQKLAVALQNDGWHARAIPIWRKTSCMPESVKDRPTHSYSTIIMLTKSEHAYYDWVALQTPSTGKARRSAGKGKIADAPGFGKPRWNKSYNRATQFAVTTKNARDVLTFDDLASPVLDFPSGHYKGEHFATFPPKLVEWFVTASTSERACAKCGAPWWRKLAHREAAWSRQGDKADGARGALRKERARKAGAGGRKTLPPPKTLGWLPTCGCGIANAKPCVVLDPFAGSGTVAEVARKMGRDWILIENNEGGENGYRRLIEERLHGVGVNPQDQAVEGASASVDGVDGALEPAMGRRPTRASGRSASHGG
jgi:DNA modification methylase